MNKIFNITISCGALIIFILFCPGRAQAGPTVTLVAPTGSDNTSSEPADFGLLALVQASSGTTITKVEFYNGSTLIGTATTSPFPPVPKKGYLYNCLWPNVPAGTYELTAKAYDSNNNTATSSQVWVGVYSHPQVTLTAPSSNTSIVAGTSMTLNATASSSDGTISNVQYFATKNSFSPQNYMSQASVGTATSSPYSITWKPSAGFYSLMAIAMDSNGISKTSAPILVTVNPVAASAATVNLTSPNEGDSFASNSNITLSASVTPPAGKTISKVEFYNGISLLATATTAPYTATWTNALAGNYTLEALAYDSYGNTTLSPSIQMTVQNPAPPSAPAGLPPAGPGIQTVNYNGTNANITNPERGFNTNNEFYFDTDVNSILAGNNSNWNNNLYESQAGGYSVIRVLFYLFDARTQALSAPELNAITQVLTDVRNAGLKVILRFAYTQGSSEPDATLSIVETHIAQLKTILQQNEDVIAYMNLGFFGWWGEEHDSSTGNDSPANTVAILNTLLTNLPSDRMTQFRYAQQKWTAFNIDKTGYLTPQTAYTQTPIARVGAFNDCFVNNAVDSGTYTSDVAGSKSYYNHDNNYVPQSGEVCAWQDLYSQCGNAMSDFAMMHWSDMERNGIFHGPTNPQNYQDQWKQEGCFDDIQRGMGYRFVMLEGQYSSSVTPGGTLSLTLQIQNLGFAAPYNSREVDLVLRNTATLAETVIKLPDDPRFWSSGTVQVMNDSVTIPSTLAPGTYALYLELPDPKPTLHGLPEYSIQMANSSTWEATTGYNNLNATVTVGSPSQYALTVSTTGTGYGTIISSDGVINCGVDVSSPVCSDTLTSGATVSLTEVPASENVFNGWSGACSGAAGCTLTISGNTNVSASFIPETFTITPSAGSNGSINPANPVSVNDGANQTFTVTPNAGYSASITVDGTSANLNSNGTYFFSDVTANHTIAASFTQNTYTLTATTGTGGTITPAGATVVNSGGSQKFTVAANSGYSINAVTLDGTAVTLDSTGSFTVSNVMANHTIAASFTQNTYTLTATTGTGGTITPAGATVVNSGASQKFTVSANSGYSINAVTLDGAAVTLDSTNSFTVSNVMANHTIAASFTQNTFTLTATAGTGGTITPAGATVVDYGASQKYTVSANSGYSINAVTLDGAAVTLDSTNSFTVSNVMANHTIAASFTQNTFTLTATAGTGGTITPAGATVVNSGASQKFTVAANTGYSINQVTLDGSAVTLDSSNSFTVSNVMANHAITASFVQQQNFSITVSVAGTGGGISPSGILTLKPGSSQAFVLTPNSNYTPQLMVDGAAVTVTATVTQHNISNTHWQELISAGVITSSGVENQTMLQELESNPSEYFPNTNDSHMQYVIGILKNPQWMYTLSKIMANHTLSASFQQSLIAKKISNRI